MKKIFLAVLLCLFNSMNAEFDFWKGSFVAACTAFAGYKLIQQSKAFYGSNSVDWRKASFDTCNSSVEWWDHYETLAEKKNIHFDVYARNKKIRFIDYRNALKANKSHQDHKLINSYRNDKRWELGLAQLATGTGVFLMLSKLKN